MNPTAEGLIRWLHLLSTPSVSHVLVPPYVCSQLLASFGHCLRNLSDSTLLCPSVCSCKCDCACGKESGEDTITHGDEIRCDVTGMREDTRGCADKMAHSGTALRQQPDNMVFGRYVKDFGRSFYWGEGTCCRVKDVCHFNFFFLIAKSHSFIMGVLFI